MAALENQISFEKNKSIIFEYLMWAAFYLFVMFSCAIILMTFISLYEYFIYLLSDKEKLFVPFIEKIAPPILAAISGAVPTFLIVRQK